MTVDESRRVSVCEGKQRFNEKLAKQIARTRRSHGRTRRKRVAYPCPFCRGWHVGSPIKTARRAR